MSNYLKPRKLNPFLLNTTYVGPTFNLFTFGTSRNISVPSVNLYAGGTGSYYFYNPFATSSTGFTDVSRQIGLSNLYKVNQDFSPDAIFNSNTASGMLQFFRIADDSSGTYISLNTSNGYFSSSDAKFFFKLLPDGNFATVFNQNAVYNINAPIGSGAYFNNYVNAIKIQSDGKILVGGAFDGYKGYYGRLIRLNVDGTLDTAFATNMAISLSGVLEVFSIQIQTNGKIIFGYNNTSSALRFKRINPDGTEDTSYLTNSTAVGINNTGTNISSTFLQSDGKLLIFGGSLNHLTYGVCYVLRLNTDGTEDLSFTNNVVRPSGVNAFNASVNSVAEVSGKLYMSGSFSQWTSNVANQGLSSVVSFNSDLTLNASFNDVAVRNGTTPLIDRTVGTNPSINLAVSSSGKLIVTGNFINYKNINFLNYCIFLNPANGALDIDSSKKISNYGTRTRKFHGSVSRIRYSSGDNSYIAAGNFITYGELFYSAAAPITNSNRCSYVLKLNSDGTVNNEFNDNTVYTGVSRFNAGVSDVAIQNDSKVILAGSFTNVSYSDIAPNNINNINYFLRLNSDGTPDQSFILNSSIVLSGAVYVSRFSVGVSRTLVLSSGKILIAGGFSNYNGSAGGTVTGLNRFIRLNSDGTEDRVYNDTATRNGTTGKFNNTISAICELPSGQVLLGGAFTNYGGTTNYNRLIMLSASGSVGATELSFINNAVVSGAGGTAKFGGSITSIVQQSDGKILIGGSFLNYGTLTGVTRLIRLNSNGTLDTAFSDNLKVGTAPKFTAGQIDSITVDSDGKILVGGTFDYASNGSNNSHYRFIKLNSDGTLDTSFSSNAIFSSIYSSTVSSCLILNNSYYVVGNFYNYFQGRLRYNYDKFDYFVMLNKDGTIK
jgi:uncharacterized delta-60 repeat protein